MIRYYLFQPASKTDTWTRLRVAEAAFQRDIFLPYANGVSYIFRERQQLEFDFTEEYLQVQRLNGKSAFQAWFKFLIAPKDRVLRFGGFDVLVDGGEDARKAVGGAVRRLRKSGAPLDGPVFKKFPELLIGWQSATRPHLQLDETRTCVVAHMYYTDVWERMEPVFKSVPLETDIIITCSSQRETLISQIRRSLPHATIFLSENSGKDVRPFLLLLEQGRLDGYDYVCKLHGKKSTNGGRNAILGDIWRNRMIFDLIAAPGATEAIVKRFEQHSDVGMIGPTAYRYPSCLCNLERSWGGNEARVLEIAGRLGMRKSDYVLDFFCGTMFWVKPEALKPLRELRLSECFGLDDGAIDGRLEHAIERLFTASAKCAGYRVEGVSGTNLTFSNIHL